ncbi:MAG: spermidine synthase [Planctomycetota bacterium]
MFFPQRYYSAFLLVLAFLLVSWFANQEVLAEKALYDQKSAYNRIIVTEDERGMRTLRFEKDGGRQSVVKMGDPDHLELPYARVMLLPLACVEAPQRVLIVGLGGGTIPMFLRRHFPETSIDVVEIDPKVVAVAKRFFGFREDAKMQVHVEDGRRFIEKHRDRYDIIFLDAYDSGRIPYHLVTREFLDAVRDALTARGVVAGNLWSTSREPPYRSMVRTYDHVFKSVKVFDVPNRTNRILIATARAKSIRWDKLSQRAEAISKRHRWGFNLGVYVRGGMQDTHPHRKTGRVLKDPE